MLKRYYCGSVIIIISTKQAYLSCNMLLCIRAKSNELNLFSFSFSFLFSSISFIYYSLFWNLGLGLDRHFCHISVTVTQSCIIMKEHKRF